MQRAARENSRDKVGMSLAYSWSRQEPQCSQSIGIKGEKAKMSSEGEDGSKERTSGYVLPATGSQAGF